MTKEEFSQKKQQFEKKITDLQPYISELNQEIRLLKQAYIKEYAEFKMHEKVKISIFDEINDGDVFMYAFVSDIYLRGMDIKYNFKKCKKDGTMSHQNLQLYFIDYNIFKI